MTSLNIVLRIWWGVSSVEYLTPTKRKFLIIFSIDVAGMGQRWRTFDSKWYEMGVMAKMGVDYVRYLSFSMNVFSIIITINTIIIIITTFAFSSLFNFVCFYLHHIMAVTETAGWQVTVTVILTTQCEKKKKKWKRLFGDWRSSFLFPSVGESRIST